MTYLGFYILNCNPKTYQVINLRKNVYFHIYKGKYQNAINCYFIFISILSKFLLIYIQKNRYSLKRVNMTGNFESVK